MVRTGKTLGISRKIIVMVKNGNIIGTQSWKRMGKQPTIMDE
jgi:hypothetical protein